MRIRMHGAAGLTMVERLGISEKTGEYTRQGERVKKFPAD